MNQYKTAVKWKGGGIQLSNSKGRTIMEEKVHIDGGRKVANPTHPGLHLEYLPGTSSHIR